MIVLRTPKGWTGPHDRRRAAGRGHLALPPGAAGGPRRQPRAPRAARAVDAQLPARGALRRRRPAAARARGAGAAGRPADGREPARQRRDPAARPRPARLPRLRGRRAVARRDDRRADAGARRVPARRDGGECAGAQLPARRPRRDRVEPAAGGVRGDRPGVHRRDPARRRPPLARRPGHGGAVRAPVPGLARGLPAHRPPRPVLVLRGVRPHRGLDVQPAREVAEGDTPHPVAAPDRLPQLPVDARTSGARTTTGSRTRTRGSSTTWSTRRPRSCGSTCRRTRTAF